MLFVVTGASGSGKAACMHAVDLQWRPDVTHHGGAPEMRWDRWAAWRRGDPRWQVWTLDTARLNVEHVVEQVAQWIERIQTVGPVYGRR